MIISPAYVGLLVITLKIFNKLPDSPATVTLADDSRTYTGSASEMELQVSRHTSKACKYGT